MKQAKVFESKNISTDEIEITGCVCDVIQSRANIRLGAYEVPTFNILLSSFRNNSFTSI